MEKYPVEFREKVILEALSSGKSHGVLVEEFGIGYLTLGKWLRVHRDLGEPGLSNREKRPQDWTGSNA